VNLKQLVQIVTTD